MSPPYTHPARCTDRGVGDEKAEAESRGARQFLGEDRAGPLLPVVLRVDQIGLSVVGGGTVTVCST